MNKNNSLNAREKENDSIMAVAIVEDEIRRFEICQTRKKVVNHEEYIRGLIDMGLKLKKLSSATGKRLQQCMVEQKRLKIKQLDKT